MASSKRLHVGGLSWKTDDEVLKSKFSGFGTVIEAEIMRDRVSHRSRGFGFVQFETVQEAVKAREAMQDTEFGGRKIRVEFAPEYTERKNSIN